MEQAQESPATEELPRCETVPGISLKLEEKVAKLTSSEEKIPLIINLKNGRIIGPELRRAYEVLEERHPDLIAYLK